MAPNYAVSSVFKTLFAHLSKVIWGHRFDSGFSMECASSFDLKTQIEQLAELEANNVWKPFPETYINKYLQDDLDIPQISMKNESVHVVCKITDDFATMQQFSFDEDSLPPKVICWNDLSALDIKMATKTVKAGLEHEYKCLVDDLSISFQSVSYGNRDPLPCTPLRNHELLVYHVIDPTLTQKSRITPAPVINQKVKMSRSSPMLKDIGDSAPPINIQRVQQLPIQEDFDCLRRLSEEITTPAIFILDCSYASRALRVLQERSKPFIIFAATSNSLLYMPQLPCDLFSSCLLTPAKVALLMQSQSYSDIHSGLLSEIDIQSLIDLLNDSPMAQEIILMLEQALIAYVDRMAYEMLEDNPHLYYSIFRKTPLISRFFTNYLFAVRVMKAVSTHPVSSPQLPDLSNHVLWDSFSLQVDRALYSIRESMRPSPKKLFSMNDLLQEHMNRLESWLLFPKRRRQSPEELPYIPLLLSNPIFFETAIKFCSRFVGISQDTVQSFLNTRSFPILPEMLKTPDRMMQYSSQTIANFSLVIVNCLVHSPNLMASIAEFVNFWLNLVKSESDDLLTASLCCLLLFSKLPNKIELYREKDLHSCLLDLVNHKSANIRTLCHLILSEMSIALTPTNNKIIDENSPLCRAAIISRIASTIGIIYDNERVKTELLFNLLLSLNDPYQLVREESIIALSRAINNENKEFLSSFETYLNEWRDEKANSPIITVLGHELQILLFDPSPLVNDRLSELFLFLSNSLSNKPTNRLESHLNKSCITTISQSSIIDYPILDFSANVLEVTDNTLLGSPSISPSGLFACGDKSGRIHCQTTTASSHDGKSIIDFFSCQLNQSKTQDPFRKLITNRTKTTQTVEYLSFIDDFRLMSVSNRSQSVVINLNSISEPESAFWLAPPDSCNKVIVDYNYKTFQLLHSTGSSISHILDLEMQKNIMDIRLPRSKTSSMNWLKPYSSLFCVAQESVLLFDTRSQNMITSIPIDGRLLIDCNASNANPLSLCAALKSGDVSMIDMRVMKTVSTLNIGSPINQFEIHNQFPFGVGIGNSFFSVSFENNVLCDENQDIGFIPDSFALHQSESSCAVRYRNSIKCVIIDY